MWFRIAAGFLFLLFGVACNPQAREEVSTSPTAEPISATPVVLEAPVPKVIPTNQPNTPTLQRATPVPEWELVLSIPVMGLVVDTNNSYAVTLKNIVWISPDAVHWEESAELTSDLKIKPLGYIDAPGETLYWNFIPEHENIQKPPTVIEKGRLIFKVQSGELHLSQDSGESWVKLSSPGTMDNSTRIAIFEKRGEVTLLVSPSGEGVWKKVLSRPLSSWKGSLAIL